MRYNFFLNFFKKIKRFVFPLLVINIILILFFGLNPKSISFQNTAKIENNNLVLVKKSFAYSYIKSEMLDEQALSNSGFSFEALLKPRSLSLKSKTIFRLLLSDKDENDIYIFQWKDDLIVTLGRDYSYKKKRPRVKAKLTGQWQKFTLKVLNGSMQLYIDEVLVDVFHSEFIILPKQVDYLLKIGDYSSLSRGWSGKLLYISIFLNEDSEVFSKPIFQYGSDGLNKGNGPGVNSKQNLLIPKYPIYFDREFLAFPVTHFVSPTRSLIFDIVINVLGFIPFGFLLALYLMLKKTNAGMTVFLFVLVFGFLLSFLIECAQSWLPVRSSSGLDLLLNTMGAMFGAFTLFFVRFCDKITHKFFGL